MKAAWLILNFTGLGLIVWGALYNIDHPDVFFVIGGMLCMALSVQFRKRAFRKM